MEDRGTQILYEDFIARFRELREKVGELESIIDGQIARMEEILSTGVGHGTGAVPDEDIPEGVTGDLSECKTVNRPGGIAEDFSEDKTEKMTDDRAEDMTEVRTESRTEDIEEDLPEGIAEDLPENITEGAPESIPEAPARGVAEDLPESIAEDLPENITGGAPESIQEAPARGVAEDLPESVAEDLPENITEGAPESIQEAPAGDASEEIPLRIEIGESLDIVPLGEAAAKTDAVVDRMAARESWRTDMPGTPVNDIRSAISLNDRIIFINTLFGEDPVAFKETLSQLNGAASFEDGVRMVLEKHPEWNTDSETVYRFMMAVRRKLK